MQFKAIFALAFAFGAIATPTITSLLESREAMKEAIKTLVTRDVDSTNVDEFCGHIKKRDADMFYETGC